MFFELRFNEFTWRGNAEKILLTDVEEVERLELRSWAMQMAS